MRTHPPAAALGLTVFLLLAGCAESPNPALGPASTEPPPLVAPDADYGGIEGFVVGADVVPIANATVALLGTNLSSRTDATGYYALLPLPPGDYKVQANASGYAPVVRSLALGAGQGPRIDFTLYEIPNPEPYVDDAFVRRGQIQCTVRADAKPAGQNTNPSCSDVAKDQTAPYVPPTQGANISVLPGMMGLLVEVEWQGSVPLLGERLRVAVRVSEADTWRQFEGESVLRVELGPALLADMGEYAQRNYTQTGGQLFFNLYPGEAVSTEVLGAGATFQQDYTMYVTVFYRQEPVPGFTRAAPG